MAGHFNRTSIWVSSYISTSGSTGAAQSFSMLRPCPSSIRKRSLIARGVAVDWISCRPPSTSRYLLSPRRFHRVASRVEFRARQGKNADAETGPAELTDRARFGTAIRNDCLMRSASRNPGVLVSSRRSANVDAAVQLGAAPEDRRPRMADVLRAPPAHAYPREEWHRDGREGLDLKCTRSRHARGFFFGSLCCPTPDGPRDAWFSWPESTHRPLSDARKRGWRRRLPWRERAGLLSIPMRGWPH